MTPRRLAALISSAAAACAIVGLPACRPSPTAPVVTPPANAARQLTIGGNTNLGGPNESSQLTATVTLSDGTTKIVTGSSAWSSRNRDIATISSQGVLTGVALGVTTVDVTYTEIMNVRASIAVRVMPEGTHMITGAVREPGDLGLADATVELLDGPSAPKSTRTSFSGSFSFVAIAGDRVTLQASKSGYVAGKMEVSLSTDVQNAFIELRPVTAYIDIAGTYRMTVSAASSCDLPAEATERTYTAAVVENGARLTVTLSGAQFYSRFGTPGNKFQGRVSGSVISLTFGADDYYAIYDVAELLTPTTFLNFGGVATLQRNGSVLSGPMAGNFEIRDVNKPFPPIKSCAASDHRVTLTPMSAPLGLLGRR